MYVQTTDCSWTSGQRKETLDNLDYWRLRTSYDSDAVHHVGETHADHRTWDWDALTKCNWTGRRIPNCVCDSKDYIVPRVRRFAFNSVVLLTGPVLRFCGLDNGYFIIGDA
jgi:hypothetical protein